MGAFISFAREWTDTGYFIESADEGLTWGVSYGELDKMFSYAEECGIKRDLWPEYIDVDGRSDSVQLADIRAKNKALSAAFLQIDVDRLRDLQLSAGEQILEIVRDHLNQGYLLFISH